MQRPTHSYYISAGLNPCETAYFNFSAQSKENSRVAQFRKMQQGANLQRAPFHQQKQNRTRGSWAGWGPAAAGTWLRWHGAALLPALFAQTIK